MDAPQDAAEEDIGQEDEGRRAEEPLQGLQEVLAGLGLVNGHLYLEDEDQEGDQQKGVESVERVVVVGLGWNVSPEKSHGYP